VNSTGLAAGTTNGTITVSSTDAANSPQTVPVTLVICAPGRQGSEGESRNNRCGDDGGDDHDD
jgi:hypothetical protein